VPARGFATGVSRDKRTDKSPPSAVPATEDGYYSLMYFSLDGKVPNLPAATARRRQEIKTVNELFAFLRLLSKKPGFLQLSFFEI